MLYSFLWQSVNTLKSGRGVKDGVGVAVKVGVKVRVRGGVDVKVDVGVYVGDEVGVRDDPMKVAGGVKDGFSTTRVGVMNIVGV